MKNLATTAIVSAVVAALVASGATYAAMKINGHSIALHSIPLNRIEGKLPRGPRGVPGTAGIYVTEGTGYVGPGLEIGTGCRLGDIAIGGGYDPPAGWPTKPQFTVFGSNPGPEDRGWQVSVGPTSYTTDTSFINVYAICAPAS